jgi:hypothetical protein
MQTITFWFVGDRQVWEPPHRAFYELADIDINVSGDTVFVTKYYKERK